MRIFKVPLLAVTAVLAATGVGHADPLDPGPVLSAHNLVRQNVNSGQPPNAGLGGAAAKVQPKPNTPLAGFATDPGLAAQAQTYADTCVFSHDPNRGRVGENLFVSSVTTRLLPASEVVNAWTSEADNYRLESNSCAPGKVCGHYTQVVWASSLKLGCGAALCPNGIRGAFPGQIWVCRYDPPGNFVGQRPYEAG